MNEPKFTKGPWKAHGTQDVDWVETEWKGHNGPANETRETTEYICKCGRTNGFYNSLLIAAAPEMYAMLEDLLDKFRNDEFAPEIEKLLKKARGEA